MKGFIVATEHRMQLKPGSTATDQILYRQGPEMSAVTQTHVYGQMKAGFMEAATREWARPVSSAPNKDGKPQFCVYYRRFKHL